MPPPHPPLLPSTWSAPLFPVKVAGGTRHVSDAIAMTSFLHCIRGSAVWCGGDWCTISVHYTATSAAMATRAGGPAAAAPLGLGVLAEIFCSGAPSGGLLVSHALNKARGTSVWGRKHSLLCYYWVCLSSLQKGAIHRQWHHTSRSEALRSSTLAVYMATVFCILHNLCSFQYPFSVWVIDYSKRNGTLRELERESLGQGLSRKHLMKPTSTSILPKCLAIHGSFFLQASMMIFRYPEECDYLGPGMGVFPPKMGR